MTALATTPARRLAAWLISAGILVGVSTPAAVAGHDKVVKNAPVCYVDDHGAVVLRKTVKKLSKFERGFYEGMSDGVEIGFDDGFYGEPFCDVPRRWFKHPHRQFARGYAEGFAVGYGNGFERGRHQRFNGRHVHRIQRTRIDPYRSGRVRVDPYRSGRVRIDPFRRFDRWFEISW